MALRPPRLGVVEQGHSGALRARDDLRLQGDGEEELALDAGGETGEAHGGYAYDGDGDAVDGDDFAEGMLAGAPGC